MPYPIQWLLSLIFNVQMYLAMFILALFYTPGMIFSRKWAHDGITTYCRWVRFSARYLIGLKTEIRGAPPTGEVIIASKHQSFLDIIMICSVVHRRKFIMKSSLQYAPILGQFALRIGCVPVNRGKRTQAIRKMKTDVEQRRDLAGQLIIYPQGTRVAAGADKPYKIGTGVLYEQLGQTCIPAATNVGVFWPRHGIYRKRGTAVMEFLPPIAAGLPVPEFMARMEHDIESASNALMIEAGMAAKDLPPVKSLPAP